MGKGEALCTASDKGEASTFHEMPQEILRTTDALW